MTSEYLAEAMPLCIKLLGQTEKDKITYEAQETSQKLKISIGNLNLLAILTKTTFCQKIILAKAGVLKDFRL